LATSVYLFAILINVVGLPLAEVVEVSGADLANPLA
jgi:hypothetical protein